MIRQYKKEKLVDKISQDCNLYKVTNKKDVFFMYEFTSINESDEYNFKMIKKLATCMHVLGLIERFEQKDKTYFITQSAQSDLLLLQFQQPNQIFDLNSSLRYFVKIIQIIEEIHRFNIIFRNLRLENIKIKNNQLYLTDFTLSQTVRRKQRYFQVIGVNSFLAPEFFNEDGYGFEIDIWAAGVCLYFMLTGEYPFQMKDKNQEEMKEELLKKCKKGFKLQDHLKDAKKSKLIESNNQLQNLFKRLFQLDYSQRIRIKQIKSHPVFKQIIKSQQLINNHDMMSVIIEKGNQQNQSLFVSIFKQYPCHYEFHKEEIILGFMECCSEILMLDQVTEMPEKLKVVVNFSILKVAFMKATHLLEVMFGKREPHFKIDPQEWENMRKSSAFPKVRAKIQRKRKIIQMLFKSSLLNVQKFIDTKSDFYSEQIPSDFSLIKHEYRKNISRMYELSRELMKQKLDRTITRKSCQNLTRLTILCLVNRIFQQSFIKQNFKIYFEWAKKESLEDLEEWIENQKISKLKMFIKGITARYMQ